MSGAWAPAPAAGGAGVSAALPAAGVLVLADAASMRVPLGAGG